MSHTPNTMYIISPTNYEAALEWMRERIGQTVYRAAKDGDCSSCTENGIVAVEITDEAKAMRCAKACDEMGITYHDLYISVKSIP